MKSVRILHQRTGELIAEGPVGLFDITPFEGNYYISRRHLKTDRFATSWILGLCPYKGLYVWLHYIAADTLRDALLGWRYFLPNPLFFFIAFRVAVPQRSPEIRVETMP